MSSRKVVGHLMSDKVFNAKYEKLFESIVDSKDTIIYISCNPENPDEIYSYVICNSIKGLIVSIAWFYTKVQYRKQGLMNNLFSYVRTEVGNDEPLLLLFKPKYSAYLNKFNLNYVPLVD
jgi:hypothetical protein